MANPNKSYAALYNGVWEQILNERKQNSVNTNSTKNPLQTHVLNLNMNEKFLFAEKFGVVEAIEAPITMEEEGLVYKLPKEENNFGYTILNPDTQKKDLLIIDLCRPTKQLVTLKQNSKFDVSVGKNYLRIYLDHAPLYIRNACELWCSGRHLEDELEEENPTILKHVTRGLKQKVVQDQLQHLFSYASKRINPEEVNELCRNEILTEDQVFVKFADFVPRMRDLTRLMLNYEFE